jgi:tetratricopeptide (TPR) repeat protein
LRFLKNYRVMRLGISAALCVGLLGSCVTKSLDEMAEREWSGLNSDHFIIYSEVGEQWPQRMLARLEEFRSFVINHLDLEGADNPLPFRIVLLRNSSSLQAIVPMSGVFGMYQTTYQGGFALVDMSARAEDGTSSVDITYTRSGPIYRTITGTRRVSMDGVLHEYVHHLLANDTNRRYPLWFNEGYAEYLSTFDVAGDGQAVVGNAPMHRVEALENARWIPLDLLFQVRGYEEDHGYGDLYAQSWAVVHYMLSTPERAGQTDMFLDRLNTEENLVKAFESSFEMPIAQMSARARSRARGRRTTNQNLTFESESAPDVDLRLLALDERSLLMAEMIMVFSPDEQAARPHLVRALQSNPANMRARALLASLYMSSEEDQLAWEVLNNSPGIEKNADIQCQLGHFSSGKAIDAILQGDPESVRWIEKAQHHYEAALSINQNHAEAYVGLGRTYLLAYGEDAERGFQAFAAAHDLLPTNLETQLLLGHLLFATSKNEAAEKAYQDVIAWSRDTRKVNSAKDMLVMIEEIRTQSEKPPQN